MGCILFSLFASHALLGDIEALAFGATGRSREGETRPVSILEAAGTLGLVVSGTTAFCDVDTAAFVTGGRSRDGETRAVALAEAGTFDTAAFATPGRSRDGETRPVSILDTAAFATPASGRSRDGETRPVAAAALDWIATRAVLGDVQRGVSDCVGAAWR